MNKILTISQINTYIKSLLDGEAVLNHLYLTGEISNLAAHYKSGHIYLSLKDDRSVLKAVMFSTQAKRLKFTPKDGMKVLVRGRISVYEASGQYQLYIDDMQPDGLGALNLAYEQLKERLSAEGIFAQDHKQPLPQYPEKIAVLTSPTGAAVQDILRILGRRWPLAEVLLCPCTVQGDRAVPQLLKALKTVDEGALADVIIIGRGGGSLEDLWAFNDEALARAIYHVKIPVVSAVGHETDFTICDFVSDVRASTPSAAAELCTPDFWEERERIRNLQRRLESAAVQTLTNCTLRLDSIPPIELLEKQFLEQKRDTVALALGSLTDVLQKSIQGSRNALENTAGKLHALSPLQVLSRGYAVLEKNGEPVASVTQVQKKEQLQARLKDGELTLTVNAMKIKDGIDYESKKEF